METRPILVLAGLVATAAASADVWRWVDENGTVHFSDTPVEGAEQIDVSEARRTTGARVVTPPPGRGGQDSDDETDEAAFAYESFEIASPGAEETLWNLEGVLNVSLALNPPLQSGHQVRVYFDGTPRLVQGTSFTLEEVWRGVHNIQAEVIDETGRLMIRTQPNRFYVQQNTVAF